MPARFLDERFISEIEQLRWEENQEMLKLETEANVLARRERSAVVLQVEDDSARKKRAKKKKRIFMAWW